MKKNTQNNKIIILSSQYLMPEVNELILYFFDGSYLTLEKLFASNITKGLLHKYKRITLYVVLHGSFELTKEGYCLRLEKNIALSTFGELLEKYFHKLPVDLIALCCQATLMHSLIAYLPKTSKIITFTNIFDFTEMFPLSGLLMKTPLVFLESLIFTNYYTPLNDLYIIFTRKKKDNRFTIKRFIFPGPNRFLLLKLWFGEIKLHSISLQKKIHSILLLQAKTFFSEKQIEKEYIKTLWLKYKKKETTINNLIFNKLAIISKIKTSPLQLKAFSQLNHKVHRLLCPMPMQKYIILVLPIFYEDSIVTPLLQDIFRKYNNTLITKELTWSHPVFKFLLKHFPYKSYNNYTIDNRIFLNPLFGKYLGLFQKLPPYKEQKKNVIKAEKKFNDHLKKLNKMLEPEKKRTLKILKHKMAKKAILNKMDDAKKNS